MSQQQVKVERENGYTRIAGWVDGRIVVSFNNQDQGKWVCCSTGFPPKTDFELTKRYINIMRETMIEVEKFKNRTFKRGDRVFANKTAGFNVGARGTVEFAEPNGGKVWVLRDGSSGPVFYSPTELDFL